ncbi:adenosine deaminase domain-containing protein 1 [Diretmus argenteus]
MFSARGSFRYSRGVSFSQILRKNVTDPPGLTGPRTQIPDPSKNILDPPVSSASKTAPAATPQDTLAGVIDRYERGEIHPVSVLYELARVLDFHLEMKETVTTDNTRGFYFAFCVVIDGMQYRTGMGITKKIARHKAAELALQDLLPTLEDESVLPQAFDGPPPLPVKELLVSDFQALSVSDVRPHRAMHEPKDTTNHQIRLAVQDQLTKLMESNPEFSACSSSTAAFIIETPRGCEVVAIGTGNCNTNESVTSSGRVLHDSHAVVTARRSLMRYLYRHLLMFFSKTASLNEKCILQRSSSSLLSLKSNVALHLYINELPKGTAQISELRLNPSSISALEVNTEISLHLAVEGKVFSVFSAFERSATKVLSMSTADKITQWQVLGYQGALLSHYIEPIYVQSIHVGDSSCSDIRGMKITVSQRVDCITPHLPMYYCMVQPHISLVPTVVASTPSSTPGTLAINWSQGDNSLEVVDCLAGKTVEESPFKSGSALASRLCKAAMMNRFKLVGKEADRQDLLTTSSYREAKMMAKPYQEAKNMLRAYLMQQGYGSWLVKLTSSDHFSM